jgi:ferric-dicitrate binding protein FerR (iron transport regulator)
VLAAISAGQRTVIPVAPAIAPPVVVEASSREIAQLLDWQPRLLDFDSTPLAEVVETFNGRNSLRLVIGDDELRLLPIVASIRSDNVEGFARLLEGTMGVRAERRPNGEIVLRRAR